MPHARLSDLAKGLRPADRERLRKAVAYVRACLKDTKRRTGENYAVHGCEVASVLRELTDDVFLLETAVMHDVLMHPDGKALLRASPANDEQKKLIHMLHPLRRLQLGRNTKDLDRAIEAFADDPRLVPLRMAHRLNDVRHLHRFAPDVRHRLADESLHMYSAIAGRLGMHAWRVDMEDHCFRYLQPKIVRSLEHEAAISSKIDALCLTHGKRFLRRKLKEARIPCEIESRIKSFYSTYRKMVLKKRAFHELTDRLAIRILVPSTEQCYVALGVVHSCFHPIPGKLKDYIGAPKENGYRSIHTVVYPLPGVSEQPIEIQIRSQEMHEECEYGVARHGDYKTSLYALRAQASRVNLWRNLQSLRSEARSPKQFEEAMRTYFREDHLAIFDAHSTLYHMKRPVTALDATLQMYDQQCSKLQRIRINGRERPLDTLLSDGDTVEARFGKKKTVQESWLHACQHSASKAVIRGLLVL